MKKRRMLFFFLAILVGVGSGLAFGWLVAPPKAPRNAGLSQLRADFKTDLVLMTAERFRATGDGLEALTQLGQVEADPLTLIVSAVKYGEGIGYSQEDLQMMRSLFDGIDTQTLQQWQAQGGANGN